ncbi:head-tail joining protein [Trinickia dinghuensis]|uniref:Head-tail adaptor protein n=1 Tax=Trinickia dinghuensis TaxID=2291023 RepID=A0A3D8K1N3_9BURK|nr:hypothetical protein [Trinickia dinghuensis]RDU99228.1 hypothetical protein DWV00_08890 [Trinickia dinghuensis]
MPIDWDAAVLAPCHNDAFGEPATFLPAGGSPLSITGIFFNGYNRNVDLGDGADVITVKPVLVVRAEQFVSRAPQQNDGLSIASVNTTYVIRDVKSDGLGELRLELHKVSSP